LASAVGDSAVRHAEAIVGRAWVLELLRQRDQAEFALKVATADCDCAAAALASAQHDGDPRSIVAAHAVLERAVEVTRESSAVCLRIRQTAREELDLLERASKGRAISDQVRRIERDRSAIITRAPETPSVPSWRTRTGLASPSLRLLMSRCLRLAVLLRVATARQP
jgi:hypothetical protein